MITIFKPIFILSIYFSAFSEGKGNVDQRIINGKDAIKSEFPWVINMVSKPAFGHRCGGVIINQNWVLTAGHCLTNINASEIQLVAGDHNRTDADNSKQRRDVSQLVVHPNYIPTSDVNKTHDFALVRVSSPFQLTNSVKKINLPQYSSPDAVSGQMTVAGWGLTNFYNKTIPDILQKVNLTIIPHQRCKERYSSFVEFTDQMFCAGDQWSSPCNGDSGSGFVEITRDPISNCKLHVLYGIVSFGSSSCNGGTTLPAVFGYVPSVLDWIHEITNESGSNTPTNTTCGIEDSNDSDGGGGNNSSNAVIVNSHLFLFLYAVIIYLFKAIF